MKTTKTSLICALMFSLTGCSSRNYHSSQSADEIKYARDLCDSKALGGVTEGFKLALDAKRSELNSASATIGVERYKRLQQELQNYSVEWEILNQEIQIACKSYAVQLKRHGTSNYYWERQLQLQDSGLQKAETNYQAKLEQAREFIVKIQHARISKESTE